MKWALIAIGGLLLPPTFAVDGWPRYYLAALAFLCVTTASALDALLRRR